MLKLILLLVFCKSAAAATAAAVRALLLMDYFLREAVGAVDRTEAALAERAAVVAHAGPLRDAVEVEGVAAAAGVRALRRWGLGHAGRRQLVEADAAIFALVLHGRGAFHGRAAVRGTFFGPAVLQ